MTISIYRDPNDTGEIPIDTAQTARIDIGEATEAIRPEHILHPTTIRRQIDETAEILIPATMAIVLPFAPPPLADDLFASGRVGEFPTVQPRDERPGRGRHRAAAPLWTRVSVEVGLFLLGVMAGAGAVAAWVVAQ